MKTTNCSKLSRSLWLVLTALFLVNAAHAASFILEGQDKGNTNTWVAGNLQNWQELDFIPCRVRITGGTVASQTFTISFPHMTGTTPGFENFYNFKISTNVVFLSAPTLSAPTSGDWSYSFTVKVTNSSTATIQFQARLAAGAHLNTGSSLMLGGNPSSMGNLQIHKPAPGPGAPNLALVKSGPTNAVPGELITYTLAYTNKATGTNIARGSQISDILPAQIIPQTNNLGGGTLSGNTIFWDLGNVVPGAGGSVSFQARVSSTATIGQSVTNFAQALSSEDDANYSDNSSTFVTAVSCFPQVDVMLVIDRSGSMLGTPYNNARLACSNFVQNLKLTSVTTNTDQAGLASYNTAATLDQKLTNRLSSLQLAISSLPGASGNTSISSGLQAAQNELASARHRAMAMPVIVLLSDGLPTGGDTASNALYNATLAKNAGSRIFTVGLGAVDHNLMGGIATTTNDYFYTTNSAELTALFNAISTAICRPPTNVAGPYPVTVCPGSAADFYVTAAGCDAFTYQWRKNGVPLTGQTNNSLAFASVVNADAGTYSVVVSSPCKTMTNSATLTVNTNVTLLGPSSQVNCTGANVTLSSTVSGTGPIFLQWAKNGTFLDGQTNSTLSLNVVTAADAGDYSLIAIGACGAPVTNTATLSVTAAPAISCPSGKTMEAGTPWTFDAPTGNYPVIIVNTTTNAACGNSFTATRTWQVTDACGNSVQCSQTVTVADTTAPVLTCAANKTVECGPAWSFDAPTTSDGTISMLSTTTNAACGNSFSATRTWKATDACGNVSQCNQTVTVVDTTAPVVTCSANKIVEASAAWTFDAPTATDACGTNAITVLATTTNTACGNTLTATRTWKATDACGNSSQCSQTVTVNDTTAPTLTCVANKTVECGSEWTFDAPATSDGTISVLSTITNAACGNTFSATRTWKATDDCGNSSQCTQTVTVVDTTAPVITCVANKTIETGAAWTFDAPSATDVCGTNAIAILSNTTNAGCGNTLTATRTWTATDACGNVAQCSQTVTVVDTTAPSIVCAASKTIEAGVAWNFDAPSATDIGGTNSITILGTVTNTACGNTFSATRTWKATDACGNSAQCNQTVMVNDTTAPTITCVANKTVECGTAWTFDAPTATDGTITVFSTVTNAACGSTFSATCTWKVRDDCGNASQCAQTVTVVDTTAPVITCAANKTIEAGAAWTFDAPTAADICGTNAITILSTMTNTACGSTFMATRTWKAMDACGNTAQCSQTVTVNDTTAPTLTCIANKTVECGSIWTFDAPANSDGTLSIVSTMTNAACGNTFSATRTWKATDACGNNAQCSQTVTVVDTTAPVITCAANKTVETGATWTFDAPTATDTCGTNAITLLSTMTNALCGNTFTAIRTWKATDACGNTAQCSQTVTVNDTTAPTLTCVANKTVECGAAWNFDAPSASDIGGTNSMTILSTTTNAACGQTFSATRTWKSTDACGNVAQCSQTVTVVDTTAPVITCAANKTVEAGVAWTFDAPTATDGCGTNTITILSTTTNATCGNTFNATRTWKATDACGNSSQCSQTVTVNDTTAPTLTCVASKTVECGAAWTFDAPSATDIGGTNTITILNTLTNAACGNTFSATRTWKSTDACGNIAQCSQAVTVVDTTAPIITCAANKTIEAGAAWTFDAPTAADGCGTNAISILTTTTNALCGNTLTATRTWKATDACGNTAQCSQTVTVNDTTAPTLTCVANKTVECGSAWTFDAPSATDIGGTNAITVLSTTTNATCGNTFSATRTWKSTDACGNNAQCSQTVTIADTTAPVIICSANKAIEAGAAWNFDAPTATDTCGTNVITIISTTTNALCGNTLTATRTWKATDACGNSSQCSQTVTVNDTTAPTLVCVANKTVECGAAWSFNAPTATDIGGTNNITILSTTTNAACGNTFSATRTWKATDACGNTAQCSQTVTVVDTTAPVITCSAGKTIEAGAAWNFDAPVATDGCGTNAITILSTTTNALCGNTFTATRTWKATDACGNTAQCSQTVTVHDTTAPTLTCVANKTVECGASWNFDAPTISDGTLAILATTTNAACGSTFSATRSWTATDACGNVAQCSQTVTVVDTTAPVITCVANKTVENSAAWNFDAPTATDGCGTNAITILSTTTNSLCGSTFAATRTWKATDACGNSSQCSQTVTVNDTTAPTITCTANKTVECGAAWNFDAPSATDISGSSTIAILSTLTNAACGNTFSATRTWTATDACGNVAQCSQTVTVVDTTAPVITCAANKTVEAGAAWTFNTPTANDTCGTNAISIVSTTTNAACGNTFTATRTWKATDACGNTAQCSQTVTVQDTTAPVLVCAANKTAEAGSAWNFDAPTASEGTVQIVGTSTSTQGCSYSMTRTWQVADACGNVAQCSQTVSVVDTTAPTVTILTPTNGTSYIVPGKITIVADVVDAAGSIQNVAFYFGTNFVGLVTNGGPYMLTLTNVPVGNYELRAVAVDACGNAGTSTAVSLTVLPRPPLSIITAMHFNPQTGLLEQKVRVFNPTTSDFQIVRVYADNLTGGATIWNKSGVSNGVAYVQSVAPILPGSYVDFVIEYYVPTPTVPNPTLRAELVQAVEGGGAAATGVGQNIARGVMLSNRTFLLEFNSAVGSIYYVQYTSDLKTWKTAQQAIAGTGTRIQWVDNGLPKTESAPSETQMRYYRVIAVQ